MLGIEWILKRATLATIHKGAEERCKRIPISSSRSIGRQLERQLLQRWREGGREGERPTIPHGGREGGRGEGEPQ